MQIGLCASIENADRAIAIGYDYVVLSGTEVSALSESDFKALSERVHDERIKVLAFNGLCPADIDMVGEHYSADAARAYMTKLIDRGAALGIKNIGVGAPNSRRIPVGYDRQLAFRHAKEFMKISAELAAVQGMMLSVEALTEKYCNFINTLEESLIMADELKSDNVKLIIDFFHMRADGARPQDAAAYMKYAGDVHISGIDESTARPGRPFLTERDADWLREIVAVLRATDYDKTISIEPDAVTEGFEAQAAETLRVLREIF